MSWRDDETAEELDDVEWDESTEVLAEEPVEDVEETEAPDPAPAPGAPVVYRRGPGGSLIPG